LAGYEIWREWWQNLKGTTVDDIREMPQQIQRLSAASVDVGSIFFWANEADPNWDERHAAQATRAGSFASTATTSATSRPEVVVGLARRPLAARRRRRNMRLAKATVEGMYAEAASFVDEDARKALHVRTPECQSAQRLAAMVGVGQDRAGGHPPVSMIDTDPMLLGVENGVIDLRTGLFRPAEREDYVTKRCGVAFDPSATCPNLDAFLQRIFLNIQALIAYVQRACGYTLTGLTDEEVMFILWATGANGKSTLRETIFALMGDYAMGADASLLIAHKKQQGGPTPDVARMFGKRLVTVNETQEGDHLNESRVKFITSHDITTARFLFENPFDFTPTHKNWLTTNKKPIVKGTDTGIWRRVQMWPFLFTIPEKERDRYFRQKWLMPELPGILNWALAGLMSYHKQGLAPPPAIIEATEEYRKDMDVLGQWITARLEPRPRESAKRTELISGLRNLVESKISAGT
jgi:putative DNA primase/helicase